MADKFIDDTPQVKLSFRVTPDYHEVLKIAAAHRRQSIQEMIGDALKQLLEDPTEPYRRVESSGDERWHKLLDDILASGDEQTVAILQGNLRLCARLARRKAKT